MLGRRLRRRPNIEPMLVIFVLDSETGTWSDRPTKSCQFDRAASASQEIKLSPVASPGQPLCDSTDLTDTSGWSLWHSFRGVHTTRHQVGSYYNF